MVVLAGPPQTQKSETTVETRLRPNGRVDKPRVEPSLATNTHTSNIIEALWEYTANGIQRAGSSRGGAGSAVGHTPNDGAPVFGDGHASHGQRELGDINPTSRGPPGEEQRPAATGSVRHRSPVNQRKDDVQSEHQSQSVTNSQSVRRRQNLPPAQSARTLQSAGSSQNAGQPNDGLQGRTARRHPFVHKYSEHKSAGTEAARQPSASRATER
ncbi:hypothetical protein B0H19DRAFT_1076261 [Mycena capillaripes]|nr:hypothetical protein B0H19DRAFT_1076261 [Mycena capillaripes]